jgi:hypothetical protein
MSHLLHPQHISETLKIKNSCKHSTVNHMATPDIHTHKFQLTNFHLTWIEFGRHNVILLHKCLEFLFSVIHDDCELIRIRHIHSNSLTGLSSVQETERAEITEHRLKDGNTDHNCGSVYLQSENCITCISQREKYLFAEWPLVVTKAQTKNCNNNLWFKRVRRQRLVLIQTGVLRVTLALNQTVEPISECMRVIYI